MRQSYSILGNFRLVRPRHEVPQSQALQWLGSAHAQAEALKNEDATVRKEIYIKLLQRYGCNSNRIGSRGTELSDVLEDELIQMEMLSPLSNDGHTLRGYSGSNFTERTEFYEKYVLQRIFQLYEDERLPPEHLIHVTCTGYVAPSPVQVLISEKKWEKQCGVTHAYHMGCYASLPTLRIADGLRSAGLKRIDIVHSELCSLHLNLIDHSPEQLVVQSLFGDGYIRYSLLNSAFESDESSELFSGPKLEVFSVHEEILPNSLGSMTWKTSDWGMKMTLSKDVPKRIAEEIPGFIQRLMKRAQVSSDEIFQKAIFAIHPGGPRIIDQLQEILQLSEDQIIHSKSVFYNYGNMSSATLPHIWDSIVKSSDVSTGQWIISLAFGPGLTAFGALMRKR